MQLRELLHAIIPYSLNKKLIKRKCGFNKQDQVLIKNQVALYPPSLDLKKVVDTEIDRSIAFLPYCAKPMGDNKCPANNSVCKRKNQKCIKISGSTCNVPCSLGKMIDVLKKHGFTKDQIFIIDSDSNLFPWLIKKKEEGYKYFLPGIGCPYGVGYALDYVGKKLGYKGCIIFLDDYDPNDKKNGVCRTIHDYLNMETTDKGKRTKINDGAIQLMENILAGKYERQNSVPIKSSQSVGSTFKHKFIRFFKQYHSNFQRT